MSIHVMSKVWKDSKQQGGALIVLLAIADFADDNGRAFPSIGTLAQKSRLSERQVHRILAQLQIDGELRIDRGGGRTCNTYTVLDRSKETITPDKMSPLNGTECHPSPDAQGTPPLTSSAGGNHHITTIEPSVAPSSEDLIAAAHKSSSSAPKRAKKEITPEFRQRMRDKYRDTLGDETDFHIDQALNHKSRHKADDLGLYVQGWLNREVKQYSARPPARPKDPAKKKDWSYEAMMGLKK